MHRVVQPHEEEAVRLEGLASPFSRFWISIRKVVVQEDIPRSSFRHQINVREQMSASTAASLFTATLSCPLLQQICSPYPLAMSATRSAVPTISRVLDDGTLIELIYDAVQHTTFLVVRNPDGESSVVPEVLLPNGDRLVPYSADNTLVANRCVVLPSEVGDFGDKRDLLIAVQSFVNRYVDLSPTFEAIAAHYVLLTWVFDAFSDVGYLRLRGRPGSGKTRALLTLGSICHKAFFASGASTVSPIFHIQDAFQGTLVLDEADFRFSDSTAELTKVLNNGTTRGLPVLRTMANRNRELNPTAFRVFGPKIVAMRDCFEDVALESRFLTEDTQAGAPREDIPIHLPDDFHGEALALRNKLLAWRLANRFSVGPIPANVPNGLSPRSRQTLLGLLSLVDDPELRSGIVTLTQVSEKQQVIDSQETYDASMLGAVTQAFADSATGVASIAEIARRFNDARSDEFGGEMSNKWVGAFIRRRFRLATTKTGGVYVIPATERARVMALASRFGVEAAA